ncbi:MAG TPA: hypothetical protein VJY64_00410 [Candidatus Onthovivens sp.]|nr:hypothetical protein [Candidatus Onthovivens sp.]
MKLKAYRIIYLIANIGLLLLSSTFMILTMINILGEDSANDLFLTLLAQAMGIIFIIFMIVMIIRSFSRGTLLYNEMFFSSDKKKLNKIVIAVVNFGLVLFLLLLVLVLIGLYTDYILPKNLQVYDIYLMIELCLTLLVQTIFINIYILLFYKDITGRIG